MDLKRYKKDFRERMKKENKKVVLSKQENKITLYVGEKGKENYYAFARTIEDEKTLDITMIAKKGHMKHFLTLYHLLEYWIGYAKCHSLEKIQIKSSILIRKNGWSSLNRINETEMDFIKTIGFTFEETGSDPTYTLIVEDYKEQISAYKKIVSVFKEKKEKEMTMKLYEHDVTGENVIYKTDFKWIGHEAILTVEYTLDEGYKIKDTKGITIDCMFEDITEGFEKYFHKIFTLRKIKNIYEPPVTNLKSLLVDKMYVRGIEAKELMGRLMEKGYRNQEVEETAASAYKDPNFMQEQTRRLGYFKNEIYFKFLNHYLFFYSSIDNSNMNMEIFNNEDELFSFYKNKLNQQIDTIFQKKRIGA